MAGTMIHSPFRGSRRLTYSSSRRAHDYDGRLLACERGGRKRPGLAGARTGRSVRPSTQPLSPDAAGDPAADPATDAAASPAASAAAVVVGDAPGLQALQ